jgi:hypothetical protein
MKTYVQVHLWYLAEFFLEWGLFQTKFVDKIKRGILYSINFFQRSCRLCDNVEKHRMRSYCWVSTATMVTRTRHSVKVYTTLPVLSQSSTWISVQWHNVLAVEFVSNEKLECSITSVIIWKLHETNRSVLVLRICHQMRCHLYCPGTPLNDRTCFLCWVNFFFRKILTTYIADTGGRASWLSGWHYCSYSRGVGFNFTPWGRVLQTKVVRGYCESALK